MQVRFLEDPQQFRGAGTLARIDQQIARATAFANRIATLDHEVPARLCCAVLRVQISLVLGFCSRSLQLPRP